MDSDPIITVSTVSDTERSIDEMDEVTALQLTSAMRDLEEARTYLRNAAKRLHIAGVGCPLHRNVCLLMDAVSQEEARLVAYMGGDE